MGHSRPEVVFTENYVFGELKCGVEVLKKKKTNKTFSFVHINYSF